jgi:hypothetical protein
MVVRFRGLYRTPPPVVPFAHDQRGSLLRSAGELGGRGAAFSHRVGAGGVDSVSTLAVAAVPRETRQTTPHQRPPRSSAAAPTRAGRRLVATADQPCASRGGAGQLHVVTPLDIQPPSEASGPPICPNILYATERRVHAVCSGPAHMAVAHAGRLRNGARASPAPVQARSAATPTPSVDPAETPQWLDPRTPTEASRAAEAAEGPRPPRVDPHEPAGQAGWRPAAPGAAVRPHAP